jgi:hypothetical protein
VGQPNVLKERFWKIPRLHEMLRRRTAELLQTVFTKDHLVPFIDSMATLIQPDVEQDPQKWGTVAEFHEHVEALKFYVTARRNYLLRTFVNPPSGMYDIVTLPIKKRNTPYYFVGYDGMQIATMWFKNFRHLDSIRIESYPNSTPQHFPDSSEHRYLKRWVRITPFPLNAKFTATLQWTYEDYLMKWSEVDTGVHDEHLLKAFYYSRGSWKPIHSTVNAYANIITIDSLDERQCGAGKHFAAFVPGAAMK